MTKPLDLSQCEFEPVKNIGAIQSFGALLITDDTGKITHISENIKEFVNAELDGKVPPLNDLLVRTKKIKGHTFVELEKPSAKKEISLNHFLEKIHSQTTLSKLLQKAAETVWELTGFDRVMVYKFHEDFHGEVVAEALLPGVDSFLGLHYPASDIPPQARQIFLENWVRIIPDVNAAPVKVLGPDATGVDLTKVTMRAVSPIHIEYLRNMEVGASLTISIIVDNKLWGLFACHHRSAKSISPEVREAAETIGRFLSSMITETSIKEIHNESEKLKQDIIALQDRLEDTRDIGEELTKNSPNLVDLISSEGAAAALYIEGYWATVGKVPNPEELTELAKWLTDKKITDAYETNELSKEFPKALHYKKIASGLLAVPIPKTKHNFIFWFRPEVIETVRWAGNPDKTVDTVNGRLTPRASFDEWKQSVEGKSAPWKVWEINAAIDLKNAVIANDLKRQFEKEKRARHEAELAKHSREELMAVVSHDLRNPLSSILMNSHILKKFLTGLDEKTQSILERISRSATAMNNLIEDILNVTKLEANQVELDIKGYSLHDIVYDSIMILQTLANDKGIRLELDRNSITCNAEVDQGRMLQVFSNIIGNAIKFTPENGSIFVKIEKCGPDKAQISIKDSGPGIAKENLQNIFDRFWQAKEAKRLGTGLGLAIVKGIVERHGGEIWAESEGGKGTKFVIQLPLKQP